ncbi:hypothetical protein [Deinococcus sp. Marseille-Q6407]|uniref:hypothetical protein n=1 Tax=Deinococcus sp. Marseille-Q6407 TaxID=2969223 RepID=UPI0021BE0DBF|nr:hypothetical protein [Deinococcus sp. Marseille-Q6407]
MIARLRCTALLSLLALLPAAAAQDNSPFRVPENYLGRFGGTSPIFELNDKSDITRLGLNGIPLPTNADIRFTVAKRPNSWDLLLSTRRNDTTYLIGTENQVRRVEVSHNPYTGPQFTGLLREKGLSEVSAGYAFTTLDNKVYVYNKAGLAASGDLREPFTYTQVSTSYNDKVGEVNFRVAPLARLYTYPFEGKVHASAEVVVSANTRPTPQLLLEASHLERFATGDSVIPDFRQGRAEETNLNATYRVPYQNDPQFGIGALRGGYTHNWQNDWNYFRGDLFLRSNLLPFMAGPRAEYRLSPDGKGSWVYGLVTLGK